jgi:hypothetical protein
MIMSSIISCSKGNHSSSKELQDVLLTKPIIAANDLTDILSNSDIVVLSTIVGGEAVPISECLQDNILRLRANTTYTLLVGQKCDDTDVDVEGTWDINVVDERVQIRMNQNSGEDLFQVISYSKSFLTVITNKEIFGTVYSVIVKFSIEETRP